jgi:hypothetical protein
MRKLTYLVGLLLAALSIGVSACGSSDTETASTPTAAAPATTPTTAPTTAPTSTPTEDADADKDQDADKDSDADKDKDSDADKDDDDKDADEGESADAKDKDCDKVAGLDDKPKVTPPSNLQILDGATVYKSVGPIGKTTQYFAERDADPDDLSQQRDQVVDKLVEGGYKLLAKDQEEGSEAEAHMSGPHAVDIQVVYLCTGKVRIRYTVA